MGRKIRAERHTKVKVDESVSAGSGNCEADTRTLVTTYVISPPRRLRRRVTHSPTGVHFSMVWSGGRKAAGERAAGAGNLRGGALVVPPEVKIEP